MSGVQTAEAGAIIPVNALPGRDQLTIWWFKEIPAPGKGFASFHLPSKVGRYTVEYPQNAPKIVIASGLGTGDLGPSPAGLIYTQNDVSKVGFNPNEEHAMILGSRAYALRDDLNAAGSTSQPFVLIAYTDPNDARPRMDAYQVERESFAYPLQYDAIAGTKVTTRTVNSAATRDRFGWRGTQLRGGRSLTRRPAVAPRSRMPNLPYRIARAMNGPTAGRMPVSALPATLSAGSVSLPSAQAAAVTPLHRRCVLRRRAAG